MVPMFFFHDNVRFSGGGESEELQVGACGGFSSAHSGVMCDSGHDDTLTDAFESFVDVEWRRKTAQQC